MEERKFIDRLYQEKFKDFEAAPREDLWNDIAVKLQQKKKKPVLLPMWSRIAGVAAALALILMLGDWFNPQPKAGIVSNEDEVVKDSADKTRIATVDISEEVNPDNTVEEHQVSNQPNRQVREALPEISAVSPLGMEETEIVISELDRLETKPVQGEAVASIPNSIEEAVRKAELDEQLAMTSTPSKIEISTHAAPVYYGNLKSGNFIDSRFNENQSQGEVTYSYGVNVAYTLSDKLKIRSGVSKVSMSHNTNDIAFHAVLNPRSLESVNYSDNHSVRTVNGAINWKGSPEPIASSLKSTIHNISRGDLNQKMGFIEVPLELEYVLLDKQLGVNLIGGASTLFLDENSISISSGSLATVLGEANNLNDISFSTNIGLGLDFKVTDKFLLNLEPMFKYQINTFDAASGTYQPYYIAVYSGFSYKF